MHLRTFLSCYKTKPLNWVELTRQITSNAYLLLKDDIEEGDLNRPEMTAKLVCTLETAIFRAMQEKQY